MVEASFQDIMKLMNSMTSFESLLDSTDLVPETCIKLGIDEDLKRLCSKMSKYILHETTNDLNFKTICNICCKEIQILNFDIRTSLAIHNAHEEHRVAVKISELNKQSQEFETISVSNLIDFNDDVPSELSKSTKDLPSTDNVQETVGGKEWNLQAVGLNNIPKELLKTTPNENSLMQEKGFVNNLNGSVSSSCTCQQVFCICGYKNKNTSDLNEKLSNLIVSHQAVTYAVSPTVGDYSVPPSPLFSGGVQPQECNIPRGRNPAQKSDPNKNKPHEKNYNLNMSQNAYPIPPPPLGMHSMVPLPKFPAGTETAGFTKPYALKGRSPSTENHQKKMPHDQRNASKSRRPSSAERTQPQQNIKLATSTQDPKGKRPSTQNQPNKRSQDTKHTTKSVPVGTQQSFNIHVHMPLSGERQQASAAIRVTQPIAPQQNTVTNNVDANLELLRSKSLGYQEEMQLMFKMVRKAEGKFWGNRNFRKVHNKQNDRTEYVCNVCNTGAQMTCSFDVVKHARGKAHQNAIRTVTVAEYEYENENDVRKGSAADESCAIM